MGSPLDRLHHRMGAGDPDFHEPETFPLEGEQQELFAARSGPPVARAAAPTEKFDLESYDTIIVAFSGGKDSLACLLHLFDLGIPPERIELWHHDVDGQEGSRLMDWPCTRDYCRQAAAAFGIPIFYSWKVGGFEGEMTRAERPTAAARFETLEEGMQSAGGKGKPNTRLQFPQVSADLSVRWCSAYLKIDVMAIALRNQARFLHKRTLVVTGERADESPAREKYRTFEVHRADLRDGETPRHVDAWRPVHKWSEKEVWRILERYRINPHPAYRLGWGRVSCAACIFGDPDQWASLRAVNPGQFQLVADYERKFFARTGRNIGRQGSIVEAANAGTAYPSTPEDRAAALSELFEEPFLLEPGEWKLPAGAYGDSNGPT